MSVVTKIILTVVIGTGVYILQKLLQMAIDRYIRKTKIRHKRALAVHKLKTIVLYFIGAVVLLYIWGIDLENVWIFLTGFIGLVAIGFFAVWSILSNIFAGVILFFSQTLRIQDTIEILPDNVSGTIKDINLFFVTITDTEGRDITIPSNMIFQKMIKKLPDGPASTGAEEHASYSSK
jgi:small-conductance mechanosensitive channel